MNYLDNSLQILLNSMNSVGYWIELRENQMLSAKEATKLKVKNFKIHFWKNLLDKNKVKKVQYLIRSMRKS